MRGVSGQYGRVLPPEHGRPSEKQQRQGYKSECVPRAAMQVQVSCLRLRKYSIFPRPIAHQADCKIGRG
jgi:hypothetical protein